MLIFENMNPAENYIVNKPEPYRSILLHIQAIIEHTIPELDLKHKYKIPFYYINNKPFCYLNVTKGYVDVGFWKGNQIQIHQNHLVTENRKMMVSLRYWKLKDVEDAILIDVLRETLKLY
jgi:hypothetical protein